MVSKVLTAQEDPSDQEGAKEQEGRITRRASSRQKVTKHSTEEQGRPEGAELPPSEPEEVE